MDRPSADLLSYALRRIGAAPVALFGATRTAFSGERIRLFVDALEGVSVRALALSPLRPEEVRTLVRARTTLPADRPTVLRLNEVAGGNPRFVLALAADAANARPNRMEGLLVPAGLRQLVDEPLERLSSPGRQAALIVAEAVDPAYTTVIAAMPDQDHALSAVDEAVHVGALRHVGHRLEFTHPVLRVITSAGATPGERRAVRARLAAIEPTEAALHRGLATEGPDPAVAEALDVAAAAAESTGRCEQAAQLAELAARVTPPADADARRRRLVQAADCHFAACDPAAALELLDEVISDAPPGGTRADALWRRLKCMRHSGYPTSAWITTIDDARRDADGDPMLQTALAMESAMAFANAGNLEGAFDVGGRALQLAERTGDAALIAQCCAGLAMLHFFNGAGVDADLVRLALADVEQPLRLPAELRPDVVIGHLLRWSDDIDRARPLYERSYEAAKREGTEGSLPSLVWGLAELEVWAGNLDRASALCEEGLDVAEWTASLSGSAMVLVSRAWYHAYRGSFDAVHADATAATRLAGTMELPLIAMLAAQPLGLAALAAGDAEAANAHLGPLVTAVRAMGVAEVGLARFVPDAAEALVRVGRLDEAADLLGMFGDRAAESGRVWGQAAAMRSAGLLHALRGEPTAAADALTKALELHAGLSMPLELARTLLVAGEVHRRARQKRLAADFLTQACSIFDALDAPVWAERARSELRRVGLRGSPGHAAGLTAAEVDVARLAIAGRTNKEIAAELFMAERTVSAHLGRVYRKLDIRSRTELARWRDMLDRPG